MLSREQRDQQKSCLCLAVWEGLRWSLSCFSYTLFQVVRQTIWKYNKHGEWLIIQDYWILYCFTRNWQIFDCRRCTQNRIDQRYCLTVCRLRNIYLHTQVIRNFLHGTTPSLDWIIHWVETLHLVLNEYQNNDLQVEHSAYFWPELVNLFGEHWFLEPVEVGTGPPFLQAIWGIHLLPYYHQIISKSITGAS